jgi:hypothetical protein
MPSALPCPSGIEARALAYSRSRAAARAGCNARSTVCAAALAAASADAPTGASTAKAYGAWSRVTETTASYMAMCTMANWRMCGSGFGPAMPAAAIAFQLTTTSARAGVTDPRRTHANRAAMITVFMRTSRPSRSEPARTLPQGVT